MEAVSGVRSDFWPPMEAVSGVRSDIWPPMEAVTGVTYLLSRRHWRQYQPSTRHLAATGGGLRRPTWRLAANGGGLRRLT